jgi:putative ABC transport system permease protein
MYAYVLGGLALLILIVACLNFANLSVGRSLRRTTEIGVRKALGAHRHQLAQQFLVEALLASAGGAVLGIGMTIAVLPAFNAVVGKSLALSLAEAPLVAVGFAVITVVTTLLAGGYLIPCGTVGRLACRADLRKGWWSFSSPPPCFWSPAPS